MTKFVCLLQEESSSNPGNVQHHQEHLYNVFFLKNNSFSFYTHLPVEDHFGLREVVRIGVDFLGIVLTNDGATVV